MTYLYVAGGGAIGAVARYLLSTAIMGLLKDTTFPYGTMVVNMVGCLFIGLIMGMVEFKGAIGNEGRLFLVVGILGGFTTFSSYGYETVQLIRSGQILSAIANVAVQTCLGLTMVWLGSIVSRL